MKGDFSRSTYRPANHYSGVRLQQGRVLLDAEWNEQADLAQHAGRTANADVVGRCGTPKGEGGFLVTVEAGAKDLRIAPGRCYVDGILCENEASTRYTEQPDLPGPPLPAADGQYAVYLDVWERHLTAVDQYGASFPPMAESALGGPDTATRTRVVWQVRLAPVAARSCAAFEPPAAPTGRLRAQEVKVPAGGGDCLVPAGGGYRRLENQLYRVEVHDPAAEPVVKWSRDNGSVVSRVLAVDTATLTIVVEDAGRDDVLGFAAARWVELSDEERALNGQSGALFEVSRVSGASITVTNPDGLSLATGANPTLRRWDGRLALTAGTPTEVEDGVQVEIDGGGFAAGDHWLIPARTATGKVEWPRDAGGAPVFETRHGTAHHYCALAVVSVTGGMFDAAPLDCRPQFPPLTAITAADVSYDPAACQNLAGATTVQQAIDLLCGTRGEDRAIRVKGVSFLSGAPLVNDSFVEPEQLAGGIRIACDERLFQDSVRNKNGRVNPVCVVTVDLPWPANNVDRDLWRVRGSSIIGFTPLTLAADVNADNNEIFWVPSAQPATPVRQWIAEALLQTVQAQTHGQVNQLLCRLTLKGGYIWGPREEPVMFLDGDAFGLPGGDHVETRFPSGDGRAGGDFHMWFWLGRPD
ncbi:hypothetical protein GCM10009555_058290 [Acrocarpospora macrocephala]|uniref:Uncharacterized protein n=1 Tax=Acrocarpospora macrocephala TaxID=150177 RepID=A0A5M3WTU0_9ACTN|nr:DUF6519 domain-containing protein [Acrocarpospora macrocephala]GES11946.1 hypothetical protein Amac_055430 [Acrocarpospora macrocephala]